MLSAKVVPENVTFQTVEWSVVDEGTTKAMIQDGILTTLYASNGMYQKISVNVSKKTS